MPSDKGEAPNERRIVISRVRDSNDANDVEIIDTGLRLSEEDEFDGADLAIHRIKANPEV